MFEILALLFSWLPPPLDIIVTGALGLFLVFALFGLIAVIIDMIPFK